MSMIVRKKRAKRTRRRVPVDQDGRRRWGSFSACAGAGE